MLLFLAMPMLTIGGILFLITNLQVGVFPNPRHLAGWRERGGKVRPFSVIGCLRWGWLKLRWEL